MVAEGWRLEFTMSSQNMFSLWKVNWRHWFGLGVSLCCGWLGRVWWTCRWHRKMGFGPTQPISIAWMTRRSAFNGTLGKTLLVGLRQLMKRSPTMLLCHQHLMLMGLRWGESMLAKMWDRTKQAGLLFFSTANEGERFHYPQPPTTKQS